MKRKSSVGRRRRLLLATLVLSIGAAGALIASSALAVHDTGAFQLDGNAITVNPPPGDDWDRVCHQVSPANCPTGSNPTGASAVDWVSEPNVNSSIFTTGGSKDPQNINNWAWTDGSGGLPAKDNLLHSFAARYPNTSEGDVLFFGSDRLDNSGDAQQGFWFFQNKISLNASGGFTGLHKPGDLLVVSDFSVGGTTSTISVYEWNPTCTKTGQKVGSLTCGDANLLTLATSTAANCASAGPNDEFCGLVSASKITMPWSFVDKSGTAGNGALSGEFYEGGVNLTDLGVADKCFASVASETRSSTSTTATLKDFILGNFGACQTTVATTPKDASGNGVPAGGLTIGTGATGVGVTDSATVAVSGANGWSGTLQFSLCGPQDSTTGCAMGGTAIGQAIPVDNTMTQPFSSPSASVTSAGTYCWRADFTPSAQSAANGVAPGSDGSTTECFTVNPLTPTLSTQAGAGPVLLGKAISDTATLSGTANKPGSSAINPTTGGAEAGGSITFTAFGPGDCTTVAYTSPAVPVDGDGSYTASFTPTQTGTYHWATSYTGDSPNTDPATHNLNCSDTSEDVAVQSVPSSMSTAQSFIPNDSATISAPSGSGSLAGSVTFKVFENANCSGITPLYSQTVTVSGASPQTVSTTNTNKSTTAASVSWLVSYASTNQGQQSIGPQCLEKSALSIDNGGTVTSP